MTQRLAVWPALCPCFLREKKDNKDSHACALPIKPPVSDRLRGLTSLCTNWTEGRLSTSASTLVVQVSGRDEAMKRPPTGSTLQSIPLQGPGRKLQHGFNCDVCLKVLLYSFVHCGYNFCKVKNPNGWQNELGYLVIIKSSVMDDSDGYL